MARSGSLPFVLSKIFRSFGLWFGWFWCSALLHPVDPHILTSNYPHSASGFGETLCTVGVSFAWYIFSLPKKNVLVPY